MINAIDTHFHLDLYPRPADLLADIENNRIYAIAVTNTPSVYHFTQKICENKKYVRPALGLHPELAEERYRELGQFEDLLKTTRYIGEIGLDLINRCPDSSKTAQTKVFQKIIDLCATEGNKVLTVHSRGSESEVIERIGENYPGKVILHWYSGSLKNLELALSYGFYFSVNSSMCRSKNGRKIIQSIPDSRLLTESDGPFITNKSIVNSPLNIDHTIAHISEIVKKPSQEISKSIYENFKAVLESKNLR